MSLYVIPYDDSTHALPTDSVLNTGCGLNATVTALVNRAQMRDEVNRLRAESTARNLEIADTLLDAADVSDPEYVELRARAIRARVAHSDATARASVSASAWLTEGLRIKHRVIGGDFQPFEFSGLPYGRKYQMQVVF